MSNPEQAGMNFDLISGSIRADARDLGTFLEVLADKLTQALPGQVKVARSGGGLFHRDSQVKALVVGLGGHTFELHREGSAVAARVSHSVRGVTLKSEEVSVEHWIDELSQGLSHFAQGSSEARPAMERLLT